MILSPDDHRSLQAIDGELATCEPHLAAMFRIFSRLNAEEAPPPSEELIVAVPPPTAGPADPKPRRGWRGRRRAWRLVAVIAVPAVLLVTVLMVMFFGLTSGLKCRPAPAAGRTAARSSALVAPGGTSLGGCPSTTGTAKAAAGGNR
jgi:hypothetical protein